MRVSLVFQLCLLIILVSFLEQIVANSKLEHLDVDLKSPIISHNSNISPVIIDFISRSQDGKVQMQFTIRESSLEVHIDDFIKSFIDKDTIMTEGCSYRDTHKNSIFFLALNSETVITDGVGICILAFKMTKLPSFKSLYTIQVKTLDVGNLQPIFFDMTTIFDSFKKHYFSSEGFKAKMEPVVNNAGIEDNTIDSLLDINSFFDLTLTLPAFDGVQEGNEVLVIWFESPSQVIAGFNVTSQSIMTDGISLSIINNPLKLITSEIRLISSVNTMNLHNLNAQLKGREIGSIGNDVTLNFGLQTNIPSKNLLLYSQPMHFYSIFVSEFTSNSISIKLQHPQGENTQKSLFFNLISHEINSKDDIQFIGCTSKSNINKDTKILEVRFTQIKPLSVESTCLLSFKTDQKMPSSFSIAYGTSSSPFSTFFIHPEQYQDGLENGKFEILKEYSTFSLLGSKLHPLFRYCIHINNSKLSFLEDEFDNFFSISKAESDNSSTCPFGAHIITLKSMRVLDQVSISFTSNDNNLEEINGSITVLPLLFDKTTKGNEVKNEIEVKSISYQNGVINPEITPIGKHLELFNIEYSTHSAEFEFYITNPSTIGSYLTYKKNNYYGIKQCSLVSKTDSEKKVYTPIKAEYENEIVFVIGPLANVSTEKITVSCQIELNPKQYNSFSIVLGLLTDTVPLKNNRFSKDTVKTYSEFNVEGNTVVLKEMSLSEVQWRLTDDPILEQIEKAKKIVVLASKADPASINLLDLTLLNSPSPFEVSNYRYLANSSGKIVSARFSGGFDDFNNQDIQTALDSVINNPNNNFNNMSTSAIIDQIFSECIEAGYGCGDLCAPCTGNDACKSDFDCFSGVCSFGQCVAFDVENSGNNNSYSNFEFLLVLSSTIGMLIFIMMA